MTSLTLSFDNGPSPEVTTRVLDILAERDLRAYFFVVGEQVARPGGRDLVNRAAAEGHVIGNHTMTHDEPFGLLADDAHVADEIEKPQDLLLELGVVADPPLFRPFGLGGAIGPHLLSRPATDHLIDGGYTVALWNSVPRDWERPTEWPALALADLDRRDPAGGPDPDDHHVVMVLHDLPTGAMDALPHFLDEVARRGIEVTLDLPDSCVPIRGGTVTGDDLDHLVAH